MTRKPGQLFRNFKCLKNLEDGSDFNDFWTNRIAAAQAKFAKTNRAFEKFFARGETAKNFAKSSKKLSRFLFLTTKKIGTAMCVRDSISTAQESAHAAQM